jgi:hypothetical protein
MVLSKEAIEEYKQIYKKNFGEEISDEEAGEQVENKAMMGNRHGFLVLKNCQNLISRRMSLG